MIDDPDFTDVGKGKLKAGNWWPRFRSFFLYSLLAFSGCHFLTTGSPIPLWWTERLNHPVGVREVTDNTLILADGRSVALPFIKRLPAHDAVFLKALQHGVEVNQDGEVVGLIRLRHDCGNDPYMWYTKRINLSDLAGFMNPDGIDDAIIDPDAIKILKEEHGGSLNHYGPSYSFLIRTRNVRRAYAASQNIRNAQRNVVRSFSLDHINP